MTSPAPPAATRDGGLGVWGMAVCGGEFACVGSVDKKNNKVTGVDRRRTLSLKRSNFSFLNLANYK